MKSYISAFLDLVFPRACLGCGASLLSQENLVCVKCLIDLPKINLSENPETDKRFWGKLPVEHSISFLHYNRKGLVQRLVHELKYRNQPELGVFLGKLLGEELKKSSLEIDALVPVPLHDSKEKQRGYNQAQKIAEGLAESTEISILSHVLQRNSATNTQTQKSRLERYENVAAIFGITDAQSIQGKHIGIVDDVITTGATIEACGLRLLGAGASKISVLSIGAVK